MTKEPDTTPIQLTSEPPTVAKGDKRGGGGNRKGSGYGGNRGSSNGGRGGFKKPYGSGGGNGRGGDRDRNRGDRDRNRDRSRGDRPAGGGNRRQADN